MDDFVATDFDVVQHLSDLGVYDFIIVGSGMGGGILAEELAQRKKKVLLIEKGGPTFSTHVCNTPRPEFARGKDDSPEGNETIYNKLKSWVQVAEDSEPFVGGALHCLGGRSLVWGLWIPRADTETLQANFPPNVASELQTTWFDKAFNLVTNNSQLDHIYPEGVISATELDDAKAELTTAIQSYMIPGHPVGIGAIATELISPAPYRFPQGGYSTVAPLLNRIYARDEYLTVLMGAEVLSFNTPNPNARVRTVQTLTVRQTSTRKVYNISTGLAKVILSAGTICTASIALNSGLDLYNPLVGKGLIDHAIWGVRFARRPGHASRDPMNLQTMINICGTTALLTVTVNNNFFLAGSSNLPIGQFLERDGKVIAPTKGKQAIKEDDFDTIAVLLEFGADLDEENEVLNIPSPYPTVRLRRRQTHNDEASQIEMQELATRIRDTVISKILVPPQSTTPKPNLPGEIPPPITPGPFPAPLPETKAPRLSLLGSGIFAHETGTMRMEVSPTKPGVVDTDLQVKEFSNLYACDMSVLPYSPPANPALTLAALSMRLAEHLAPTKSTKDA